MTEITIDLDFSRYIVCINNKKYTFTTSALNSCNSYYCTLWKSDDNSIFKKKLEDFVIDNYGNTEANISKISQYILKKIIFTNNFSCLAHKFFELDI